MEVQEKEDLKQKNPVVNSEHYGESKIYYQEVIIKAGLIQCE